MKRLLRKLRRSAPQVHYSLHFHNTRGLGLANVLAGLEEGIDSYDCLLRWTGGMPHQSGGSGNIATEDLVNMLEEIGMRLEWICQS